MKPLLVLLLVSAAVPALAADPAPTTNQRVDRLEKELRAVQRKVFPGGSPAFFEPEIAPTAAATPTGTPANAPLNELTGRVNALERSLAELTAKIEEDEHRLTILSQQTAKDRGEFDARLKTLETPPTPAPVAAEDTLPPPPSRPIRGRPTKTPPASVDAETSPTVDAPAAKPASGDPGEDAYMAGYKLWADKKYPEAETALAAVIKKYPKHKRATYARNLLGRAQLDEGKPATAAQTFLANYQSDPHGERAPDSLFYLGQSLTQLKKNDNACRAFDELQDVYGATMSDSIKAKLPAARKAAACK